MKLLLVFILAAFSISANAQSFFKPLPLPGNAKVSATANPAIQNSFRPIIGVTASITDGTQLAGGVGISYQHNKFDDQSQAWITQYSVSGLAFLDTQGSVLAGLGFGFLNLFNVGPLYNFGTKKFGIMTGITIKPF